MILQSEPRRLRSRVRAVQWATVHVAQRPCDLLPATIDAVTTDPDRWNAPLPRSWVFWTSIYAPDSGIPSTNINRRSSALVRTFSAWAYSADEYHGFRISTESNATTTMRRVVSAPSTTRASAPRIK